ncbi:MAG: glutamate racemase, partial [Candidatus Kapaibacteriota bacterium]
SDVPVVGMINPAIKSALWTTRNKKIGIIGTRATISSMAYQNALVRESKNGDYEVSAKACPLFVPLVEEGLINHPATKLIANE